MQQPPCEEIPDVHIIAFQIRKKGRRGEEEKSPYFYFEMFYLAVVALCVSVWCWKVKSVKRMPHASFILPPEELSHPSSFISYLNQ
jgi:hypothetical protein